MDKTGAKLEQIAKKPHAKKGRLSAKNQKEIHIFLRSYDLVLWHLPILVSSMWSSSK